jgi:CheY-like chemotaxis protein
VAEKIQSLSPTPTPIIFLTASKAPSYRARALALGAAGFFEKPYQPEDLIAAAKSVVGA